MKSHFGCHCIGRRGNAGSFSRRKPVGGWFPTASAFFVRTNALLIYCKSFGCQPPCLTPSLLLLQLLVFLAYLPCADLCVCDEGKERIEDLVPFLEQVSEPEPQETLIIVAAGIDPSREVSRFRTRDFQKLFPSRSSLISNRVGTVLLERRVQDRRISIQSHVRGWCFC